MVNDLLELTSEIVSSYVSNNQIEAGQIPDLIKKVYSSLEKADQAPEAPAELIPAVPVKKSVFPDHIVCLEDGKKLKMLKRHLASAYDMTPEQYRAKWGLPASYPMVAPDYAEKRSKLAQEIGLGRRISANPEPETVEGVEVKKVPASRRGRKPKAD